MFDDLFHCSLKALLALLSLLKLISALWDKRITGASECAATQPRPPLLCNRGPSQAQAPRPTSLPTSIPPWLMAEVIPGRWRKSVEAPITHSNDIERLTPSSINRPNGTLSAPISSLEYIVFIIQSYSVGTCYFFKKEI